MFSEMIVKRLIGAVVRHGMNAIGVLIVANELTTPDVVEALGKNVVGTVMILFSIAWSFYQKKTK